MQRSEFTCFGDSERVSPDLFCGRKVIAMCPLEQAKSLVFKMCLLLKSSSQSPSWERSSRTWKEIVGAIAWARFDESLEPS